MSEVGRWRDGKDVAHAAAPPEASVTIGFLFHVLVCVAHVKGYRSVQRNKQGISSRPPLQRHRIGESIKACSIHPSRPSVSVEASLFRASYPEACRSSLLPTRED